MPTSANAPAADRGVAAFVLVDGPQHSAGAPGRPEPQPLVTRGRLAERCLDRLGPTFDDLDRNLTHLRGALHDLRVDLSSLGRHDPKRAHLTAAELALLNIREDVAALAALYLALRGEAR